MNKACNTINYNYWEVVMLSKKKKRKKLLFIVLSLAAALLFPRSLFIGLKDWTYSPCGRNTTIII